MSEIEQLQAENITLKKELAAARIWLYIERQKNAKAMKQALEALETAWENDPDNADGYYFDAASALREALADHTEQHLEMVDRADKFCEANCVWTDHHPDCVRAEQQYQSTADKSKLETVPAKGGLLPAQQGPSPEGVLFAVEEAIRNGGCFWQIEDAFNEYESKLKAAHGITKGGAA